jgi:hypothetical protein
MILMIQKQVFIILMTKKLTTTVPPKRGPIPQLNIPTKQVKTITSEKINGRNRQVFTQRKTNNKHS